MKGGDRMKIKVEIKARVGCYDATKAQYEGSIRCVNSGKYPSMSIFDGNDIKWCAKSCEWTIRGEYQAVREAIFRKITELEKFLSEWDKMFKYEDMVKYYQYNEKSKTFLEVQSLKDE